MLAPPTGLEPVTPWLTVWVLKTHYTHYTRLMSICQYCLPEKAAGTVKLRFLSPKGV